MSLSFHCSGCGSTIVTQWEKIGDQMACPACGAVNRVPEYASLYGVGTGPALSPVSEPHLLAAGPTASRYSQPLTSDDFSTIFTDTFRLPFTSLKKLFLISLIAAIPMQLFSALMAYKLRQMGPEPDLMALGRGMIGFFLGAFVLALVVQTFTSATMCVAMADHFLKRPVSVFRSLSDATMRVPAILGATIIGVVCFILLTVTIIGFPFAIYLGLAWCCYIPLAVLSRTGPVRSLSASYNLVKGCWWRVLGIVLVIGIGAYLIILIPALLSMLLPDALKTVISIACNMFIITATNIGGFLVFSHLRLRRQGFTIEQLAAERDALAG